MQDKARYWLLTIPQHAYLPFRPPAVQYIRGQLEVGNNTNYSHWQILCVYPKQVRLSAIKKDFGDSCHAEPSRSEAADEYVWKEETRVEGTQFELGRRLLRRNCGQDWDTIKDLAKAGQLDDIPASVFCQHYRTLRTISADYAQPIAVERRVVVYWGPTGTGKSRRAWSEAGMDSYPKDPNSKFWDGYRGHEHVIIDEFRGRIDVSHMLRWLDRYPVLVEIKGSATVLTASRIWITSNLDPRTWYPDLDQETVDALLRRLEIVHCPINMY